MTTESKQAAALAELRGLLSTARQLESKIGSQSHHTWEPVTTRNSVMMDQQQAFMKKIEELKNFLESAWGLLKDYGQVQQNLSRFDGTNSTDDDAAGKILDSAMGIATADVDRETADAGDVLSRAMGI